MEGEPQIELFATHQTVIEGSTVDLVCSFQDYCPSDVTWWMSEDVAGDTQTAPNGTLLNSGHVLRLSALLVGDSSRYCCHSNDTSGATLQACIELEVLSSGKDYYSVPIFDCTVYVTSHMIWRQVHCAKYYHLVCTVLTTHINSYGLKGNNENRSWHSRYSIKTKFILTHFCCTQLFRSPNSKHGELPLSISSKNCSHCLEKEFTG